ncbi:MAG TPA: hypothetical protein VEB59_07970, partial [Gemmatimonadales bacterium]|nr:hypothetical protein [Gemmatimonadales bacterium]
MTYTHKLSRRLAILRRGGVLVLAGIVLGCEQPNEPQGAERLDVEYKNSANGVLILRPMRASVEVNQHIQFTAYPGDEKRGALDPGSVEWTVSGGTITSGGLFTASSSGEFKVSARARRARAKSDTSVVDVVPPQPALTSVTVTPASITLAPGADTTFLAVGHLADGSVKEIGVEWSGTGGGHIDAGGHYVADSVAGTYRVIARNASSGLADTAVVTIGGAEPPSPPASLASVVITPAVVTLSGGEGRQFTAAGKLTDGTSVPVSATFQATGGVIDPSGLYTAGSSAGTYRVIASAEGLADTAAVTISAQPPSASCSSGPLTLCPGDNLQQKVNAAGAGARITIGPGLYRFASVQPLSGQTFDAQPGAVFTGARVLTGWTPSG